MSEKTKGKSFLAFPTSSLVHFYVLLFRLLSVPTAGPTKEQASSRTSVGRRKERTTLPRRLVLVERSLSAF
jgi:hypothetical protein